MPLEVMERGGWLIRDTADAFADYAALAADAFGDRVAAWATSTNRCWRWPTGTPSGSTRPA